MMGRASRRVQSPHRGSGVSQESGACAPHLAEGVVELAPDGPGLPGERGSPGRGAAPARPRSSPRRPGARAPRRSRPGRRPGRADRDPSGAAAPRGWPRASSGSGAMVAPPPHGARTTNPPSPSDRVVEDRADAGVANARSRCRRSSPVAARSRRPSRRGRRGGTGGPADPAGRRPRHRSRPRRSRAPRRRRSRSGARTRASRRAAGRPRSRRGRGPAAGVLGDVEHGLGEPLADPLAGAGRGPPRSCRSRRPVR